MAHLPSASCKLTDRKNNIKNKCIKKLNRQNSYKIYAQHLILENPSSSLEHSKQSEQSFEGYREKGYEIIEKESHGGEGVSCGAGLKIEKEIQNHIGRHGNNQYKRDGCHKDFFAAGLENFCKHNVYFLFINWKIPVAIL